MTEITFRLEGDKALLSALDAFIRRAQNLKPVYADIGEYMLLAHRERWAKQVSPEGAPWAPLSEDYKKSKRKRTSRGRDKILVLDEYLRGRLRYKASHAGINFGTDLVYANTHQFGRDLPNGRRIPARPFLGIAKEDNGAIMDILSDWLRG